MVLLPLLLVLLCVTVSHGMAWFTAKCATHLIVLILTLSPRLFAFVISAEITCGRVVRVIVIIRLIITSILLLVVLLITLVSGLLIRRLTY